ncbi:hypothetical protein WLZ34_01290 [Thermogladius sp. KZ2Tp1]|uniref:hypothetical protein n=1 Tax=Thermogladius sp. KZ2Tp1 TaxID=3136289 RepID=UPI003DA9A9D8
MANYRSLLVAVVPRLVALALVYYTVIVNFNLPAINFAGMGLVSTLMVVVAWGLVVVTIVTASPQFYGITLIFLSLLPAGRDLKLIVTALAGYFVLLFVDNLVSNYNINQYGWIRYRQGSGHLAVFQVLLFVASLSGVAFLISRLWVLYYETLTSTASSGLGILLTSTYLFKLLLLIAVVVYALYTAREFFTVFFFYMKPNARMALSILLDEESINVFYNPVFGSLRGMIIASAFAPLLYQPIYEVFGDYLARQLYFLKEYAPMVSSVVLALVSWILVTIVLRGLDSILMDTPRQLLVASLVMLAVTYAGGVYYTFKATSDLWLSLIHPDFETWSLSVVSAYQSYYTVFYSLVEYIPKMLGAVP